MSPSEPVLRMRIDLTPEQNGKAVAAAICWTSAFVKDIVVNEAWRRARARRGTPPAQFPHLPSSRVKRRRTESRIATDFDLEPEAARLEELRAAMREERIEADLRLGRHAELVAELEALVAPGHGHGDRGLLADPP